MLRILLAAACLIPLAPLHARAWTEDYEAARRRAAAESRYLLLNFTGSDWCGWCMRLDAEVFSQGAFRGFASEHLVCVTIDFPRDRPQHPDVTRRNEDLKRQYRVSGFPSLFLLNPNGRELGKLGYMEGGPQPFVDAMRALIEKDRGARKPPAPKPVAARNDSAPAAEDRLWMLANGDTIEGRLLRRTANTIDIRTRGGARRTFTLDELHPSERADLDRQTPGL